MQSGRICKKRNRREMYRSQRTDYCLAGKFRGVPAGYAAEAVYRAFQAELWNRVYIGIAPQ